jgi:hypothetical protein
MQGLPSYHIHLMIVEQIAGSRKVDCSRPGAAWSAADPRDAFGRMGSDWCLSWGTDSVVDSSYLADLRGKAP